MVHKGVVGVEHDSIVRLKCRKRNSHSEMTYLYKSLLERKAWRVGIRGFDTEVEVRLRS